MLDLFKREGDEEEYNQFLALPVGIGLAAMGIGQALGFTELSSFAGLASAVLCMQVTERSEEQSGSSPGTGYGTL
ncbi:unnamed protein product, partial [Discosporangium mesarthrocarpum]